MKPIKIGINGFGRIGRKIARLAFTNDAFEIVGVNDLANIDTLAHLLKYDSTQGTLPLDVSTDGTTLCVGRHHIKFSAEKDPSKLPWAAVGADVVHESTGVFKDKEKCSLHLKAGAKRVIMASPAKDADLTVCMGVNHESYDPSKHSFLSNASCTTNCLAPMAKVLDDTFGIVRGTMLTVHSYTNDQNLLDLPHSDLRRARAGALSMIPTSTGAAKAVGLVLPQLKGKLDGLAIRVPTPNVSMVDFTGELKKSTTAEEINAAFKKASETNLKGILGYATKPLVSIDYNGCINSSTIDSALTLVMAGTMCKVISWYDNESGFSQRMLDLTKWIAEKGL